MFKGIEYTPVFSKENNTSLRDAFSFLKWFNNNLIPWELFSVFPCIRTLAFASIMQKSRVDLDTSIPVKKFEFFHNFVFSQTKSVECL